ncbi:rho family-interacting cell polarization regulator 2 isoform X3 [Falco peregrinus]|uniref:rho family-interacting cell polarization regulator 2 isoform X3 n=1 Tax=Falco peregrinus TaxID=8954 RepID=UPI00247B02D8|nr:rho family-interacting cell polarization regulator 2 isoform X3 [Falco peregrinus]
MQHAQDEMTAPGEEDDAFGEVFWRRALPRGWGAAVPEERWAASERRPGARCEPRRARAAPPAAAGISSRLPEIMSIGSHSFSPGGPNGIIRSQSFAGFSGLQERRSRCNSFIENSSALKKPQAKVKKMHNLGHKNSTTPKEPQPKRMEEVYRALKNGLDEYLEVHQTELDKLTTQLKDMKRNSRLGVLYDLDKQIKAVERYMRRLEFHISKVDELYEAYCIQRRLCDGASKMKQAFAMSPASKAARESLTEINRSYKEYTENMCTIEAELENLLGEFSIKMKGLAGFARLCPGDQYEIFMRYGRQRWKLKGKIEVNGKQSWDGEEMVFLPLIVGLISIKVTEVKGLATHILVGSVTCETKDLFAARPQVVAVDINDLGTIKLNLEITWYPFDVEDLTPSTGNVSKASALQRRMSMYSQGTPETPTFKDHSFFSNLPDEVFENGTVITEKRPLSFTFGDLPYEDRVPPANSAESSSAHISSSPDITATPTQHRALKSSKSSSLDCSSSDSRRDSVTEPKDLPSQGEGTAVENKTTPRAAPEVCQKSSDAGSDHVFIETSVPVSLLQDTDEGSELKPVELDTYEGNITKQLVKRLTSAEAPMTPERLPCEGSISGESEGYKSYLDGSIEEALQGLLLALEPHKEQYKEFQDLDQEVMHLDDVLKQIVFSSKTPFVTRDLLDKLSRQILVMENIVEISTENLGNITSLTDAIPEFHKKLSLLAFWMKCTGPSGVYHTSADKMMKQLDINFATTVNEECPGLAETVFRILVSQILDRTEPVLYSSMSSEIITVFQYYNYFASHSVNDLGSYLLQLAKEASVVQVLQSVKDGKLQQNVAKINSNNLPPQQEVLRALALLLNENKNEVSETVASLLTATTENRHFREKALIYYCEALTQPNLQLQKAACLALRYLKATESIKMLVTLCQSDNEEIRKVASETLLSLGEDGRLAYEQLDKFPREFAKVGSRRGTETATAF